MVPTCDTVAGVAAGAAARIHEEGEVATMRPIVPDGPDVTPLMALHRGGDGYVAFGCKNAEGTFAHLWSIQARHLRETFPQFREWLLSDAYYSINSFYRHGGKDDALPWPNTFRAHRQTRSLRHLTACFVDIDCVKRGISCGQAVGSVIDAVQAGQLPAPSMYVWSGRGVWIFYALETAKGELQPAWPDKVELWARCQRELVSRLAELGGYAAAKDGSRVTRIPGSITSKDGTRVSYYLAVNRERNPVVYQLEQMAQHLGIQERKRSPVETRKSADLTARAATGAAARWRYDLERFRQLWAVRGTFPAGMRNKAIGVWVQILASLRGQDALTLDTMQTEVRELWESFPQPQGQPYPWEDAARLLADQQSAKRRTARPLRHQSIANLLEITPEESYICGWPAAGVETAKRTKREERELRRRMLEQLTAVTVPPLRRLCEMLADAGLTCEPNTVATDLKAIGRSNPRSRGSMVPDGQYSLRFDDDIDGR
jgi:hypothetical protein